jgi:autotransporter-associated beta strand protein
LKLNNGAVTSTSNSFAVQPGAVASLAWSAVPSPQGVDIPFPATLTAKDVNGYTVTGFNGTAALSGLVGSTTSASVLGKPTPDWSGNSGTYTLGYSFTPSSTILVTDVLHYFGSKISIWTATGTLVASQTFALSSPGWLDTPLTTPVQLIGGTTYIIADYTAAQTYYRWTSASHSSTLGTIGQEYEIAGDAFPTSSYAFDWYCVDILAQVGTFTNVPMSPTTATFTSGVWSGNLTVSQATSGMHLHANDGSGHTADSNSFNVVAATVAGRYVFYNNSSFDGNDPTANAQDDAAIATDKSPLLPGGTAIFANYTSYSRGINGIMIDVQGLPGTPTASDFVFKVGNSNTPGNWIAAPAPTSVTVRSGAGTGGSSRIEVTWPDGAISKEWLQVTLLADTKTGLAANNVFYWGNAVGDTGNSTTDANVNANDEILTRHNATATAGVTNADDFDRSGTVDPNDVTIVRQNGTNFMTALKLITVPLTSPIGNESPGVATWTGGGIDANWSTAANWGGVSLASGMQLSFSGVGGPASNDLAKMQVGGIAFSDACGPFVISGNSLALSGNVTSAASATQTVALPITLSGDAIFDSTAGVLNITGDISSGGTYGITTTGAGTVVLSGNNSYPGGTFVAEGKLVVTSERALPTGSDLTVGTWSYYVPSEDQTGASLPGAAAPVAASTQPAGTAEVASSAPNADAVVTAPAIAAAVVPQPLQVSAYDRIFVGRAPSSPGSFGARAAAAVLVGSIQANYDRDNYDAYGRLQALDAVLADWQ